MNYYVVIDTNVLVYAALKWNSIPGNIIEFAFNDIITPLLSQEILQEYRTVLLRPKFHLTKEIVDTIMAEIELHGMRIDATPLQIQLPDMKDLVFYEVTMEKRKTDEAYLVTGNLKHFPKEPFIVSPREMLEIIMNK